MPVENQTEKELENQNENYVEDQTEIKHENQPDDQSEQQIESVEEANVDEANTESRSVYQKRKREEVKQRKRKKRRNVMAVVSVMVILAGVLCGAMLSTKMNTPHDAIVIASANAQYVKHTVSDTLDKLMDKLPWGQEEDKDKESSELDKPNVTDNPNESEQQGATGGQDVTENTEQNTTESTVPTVTPDNPFGIDPSKPMVALTFDDGPSKYTWPIVTALYEHNARATFFLVGQRIASHEAAIEFTLANHNEIASHSYDHANLVELTEEEILSQIQKVDNLMQKQHDYTPALFRVPFGNRDENVLGVLHQQGKPVIGWSVDPRDWELQDKDAVVKHVLSHVKDGDIILLHDIHQPTAEAVAELVPALQERGYQLVTVSELLHYKGIAATPGTYYYASWKWV